MPGSAPAPRAGTSQRLPRLLALVPWLRTHPDVALGDAATAFGVSAKQIRSDIQLLFLCGLPGGSPGDLIDIDLEGDRITLRDPQVFDRPLRLTVDEGVALLVAVRALADVPGLTDRDALDRVRGKLELAVGNRQDLADASPAVDVSLEGADSEPMRNVQQGLTKHRRLHLTYLGAARDEVTERDVDPLRLVAKEGRWYLEGWCHLAEAMRLFRADRIHAVTVLDAPADLPPAAVPRDLAEGLFQPSPSQHLVELLLHDGAQWVTDYYPCEFVRQADGRDLLIGLRTPDTDWVRSLVLRLGGRAEVVSPLSLANEVTAQARAALAAYTQDPPR
jgi:proteasome accessory factor C